MNSKNNSVNNQMKPNILFLIFDAFRADKISGHNKNSITPTFDFVKENGVFFDNTISSSDGTILSYAGLFTGKHPFKTGMRNSKLTRLCDTTSYLEILKKNGYNLYGCVPKSTTLLEIIPEFENNFEAEMDYPNILTKAGKFILNKLESGMKEPWFFLVHVMNMHFPITKPKGFESEKYGNSNYEKQISAIDAWLNKVFKKIDLKNTLVIITGDHGAYIQSLKNDSLDIDFQDKGEMQMKISKVARLANPWRNSVTAEPVAPKSLESLKMKMFLAREKFNRNKKLKKIKGLNLKPHEIRGLLSQRSNPERFLFDEKIRVPLFMIGHKVNQKKTISQQIRLIDVFPTICDMIGIPGERNVDGISVYPLLQGKKIEDVAAYIESTPAIQIKTDDVIGIRTNRYKYFRSRYDPKKHIHFYDLKNDPYEDENLADKSKETCAKMEGILKNIINGFSLEKVCYEDNNDKKVENVLKKLGYV